MKPHIRLQQDNRFARVITCGPPERAALIAEHLERVTALSKNREYHSYLGTFERKDVLVTSHGVGAPGATICWQELIDVGARVIVRLGTAGGLQDTSQISDVAVATGAIRKDGVSQLMVPLGYPAVPDPSLTARIQNELVSSSIAFTPGIVLTSDLFYPALLDPEWALYQKAGAVAVEMECASLFVTGLLRKVKTASVLALDGNPLKWKEGNYEPEAPRLAQARKSLIRPCLKALVEEAVT